MKFAKFSLVLTILRGAACIGAIDAVNIADIGQDIIENYDLKSDSRLEISSITDGNTISNGNKSYSLNNAIECPIFTEGATYMFEDSYQNLPATTLFCTKIEDEVVLISRAEDGSPDGISIYSETGDLRIKYERVAHNQFVQIRSDSVDYDALNTRFRYADNLQHGEENTRNLNLFRPYTRKSRVACTTFKVIELAVAYESSFCSYYGSKAASDKQVIDIVAGVSLKYQQEGLCTKVRISHMEGFCTAATDPYKQYVDLNQSGCGPSGLLQGFQNFWNENRSGVKRDDTQLFSGTGLECSDTGCVIGCASLDTLCNNVQAYGVNYPLFTNNANLQQVLVAHELGHNCGARHILTDDRYIMFPSVNAASLGFSDISISSFLKRFSATSCIDNEAKCEDLKFPKLCRTAEGCEWDVDSQTCSEEGGGPGDECEDLTKPKLCRAAEDCKWDKNSKICSEKGGDSGDECKDIKFPRLCKAAEDCKWDKNSKICSEKGGGPDDDCKDIKFPRLCRAAEDCKWNKRTQTCS